MRPEDAKRRSGSVPTVIPCIRLPETPTKEARSASLRMAVFADAANVHARTRNDDGDSAPGSPRDATERVPPRWPCSETARAIIAGVGRTFPPPPDASEGHALSWPCSYLTRPPPGTRRSASLRGGRVRKRHERSSQVWGPRSPPPGRIGGPRSVVAVFLSDASAPRDATERVPPRWPCSETARAIIAGVGRTFPAPPGRIGGPRSVVAVFLSDASAPRDATERVPPGRTARFPTAPPRNRAPGAARAPLLPLAGRFSGP
ncbi:MAG: hypothetical protein KatS3mg076_2041 [Candidatus Binatia bacterium]|nr:MAG: hypothetical protein KatS3mg076_2041 [Candidatus Binatia bacterium]